MTEKISLYDLRCEYLHNPLGIDTPKPRLSWKVRREEPGFFQHACQIQLSHQKNFMGRAIILDTGKWRTDQSHLVEVPSLVFSSRERVFWRVRVWDEEDRASPFSQASWFEYGLLNQDDWEAQWIQSEVAGDQWEGAPCPFFRREFSLSESVISGRLYITALGLYEAFINGQRVGRDQLQPGWTDYRKRLHYQVYDVTWFLSEGQNVLGAILGDGWYCGRLAWLGRQHYGLRPRFLAQMHLTLADGSRRVIGTGSDWKTNTGPILQSDLQMGEIYDARLAQKDWSLPDADCSSWRSVELWEPDQPITLCCSPSPPVRITAHRKPVSDPLPCPNGKPGTYLFDLGQNMVGKIQLAISGPSGQQVRIRHGEMLDESGALYTENLRTAGQELVFTLNGEGREIYTPHFCFMGFRYVEVSGLREHPGKEMITGLVMHSDLKEAGSFSCSDHLVNQLFQNIRWSQKGNFLDVPTDCPQRDERLGWTGDAQVFVRTAAINMQVAPFFRKWCRDLQDAQTTDGMVPAVAPALALEGDGRLENGGPGWADALVICPWVIYQHYGDHRVLESMYPAMQQFMAYLEASAVDGVRAHPDSHGFRGYGDWLSIQAETPLDAIGTAYYAHIADLMAQVADILGRSGDAVRFAALHREIRETFIGRFLDQPENLGDLTQTFIVLALQFDLAPEGMREQLVDALVQDIRRRNNHLSCGFLGSPHLPHVLVESGRSDVAYDLLWQTTWPSWLYAVVQGATTIWERWDGWTKEKGFQDPLMNSFNHYAYGAVGDWLVSKVAGIQSDPEYPGYKRFVLRPNLDPRLSFVRAELESPYGTIRSAWRVEENGRFYWDFTVPENSQAVVHIPIRQGWRFFLADGRDESIIVSFDELPEKETMVFDHPSGSYHIEVVQPRGFV
jgi:alpha-L-rhamnosidase